MPLPTLTGRHPARLPGRAVHERRRAAALLVVVAALVTLALVVHDDQDPVASAAEQRRERTAVPGFTVLDALGRGLAPPQPAERTAGLIARIPLPRKVTQLFVVGFAGTDARAPIVRNLARRDWGGVLLQQSNYETEVQVQGLTAALQDASRRARHLPLIVGVSQEGGPLSTFPDLPPLPQPEAGQEGLGVVAAEARAAAARLRGLGVNLTLAPDADVAAEGSAASERSFGFEPGFVARAVAAAVDAYRRGRLISAVGNFPGAGAAAQDPAVGPAPVGLSLPELEGRDLRPFAAVAGRAPVIVLSNAIYVAFDAVTPATLLPEAVRLLRNRLRFRGVAMSGDLVAATAATGGSVASAAVAALEAGADLLYVPGSAGDQEAAYRAVLAAVRSGKISPARIDASLRRVLALKRRYGVMRPGGSFPRIVRPR